MFKLNNYRRNILYFMIIIFALLVIQTYAEERIDCRVSSDPCRLKGVCHSKGFCICREDHYGE